MSWRVLASSALAAVGLALAACASAPAWQQPYALTAVPHSQPTGQHQAGVLRLEAVTAPSWLAGEEYLYRLQYADPQALRPYNDARWAAAPGQMLTLLLSQRLRQQGTWRAVLGPAQAGHPELLLQLGLQDFSVHYVSATAGEAQISCTATLLAAQGYRVLAQKSFAVQAPLPRVGPAGGAMAMNRAAQDLVTQIGAWAAQHSPAAD
ncbi:ABC-type transport auxiliary lipoprotein family protein [Acidithiobacillus sp. AMEEHan]|uniref:ABC-type transport auxiliary lipoprotein family protein n=1 Tax=Acidithiobacillus sp. AMEEHan TaxID=2994951 RepID=UPI0027E597B9|nr:ABC-type transport auxiliary lipoprotein family protein [Acidithiobacillus sp. AMEEHan]